MTIQVKATEQYFLVMLVMLYKVVLILETVDEILQPFSSDFLLSILLLPGTAVTRASWSTRTNHTGEQKMENLNFNATSNVSMHLLFY